MDLFRLAAAVLVLIPMFSLGHLPTVPAEAQPLMDAGVVFGGVFVTNEFVTLVPRVTQKVSRTMKNSPLLQGLLRLMDRRNPKA